VIYSTSIIYIFSLYLSLSLFVFVLSRTTPLGGPSRVCACKINSLPSSLVVDRCRLGRVARGEYNSINTPYLFG